MEIKFTQGDSVAIPEGCTAEIKDFLRKFHEESD
jgi:hypothetical protein